MNPDPNVAYPPPTKKKGPNWFIILPCGCLSIIGLVVIIGAVGFFSLFKGLKDSNAYKESLAKAQGSAEVQEALGSPIEEVFIPMGGVAIENGTETINLGYAVKGPKGTGAVTVSATRPSGSTAWDYKVMNVDVENPKKTINLLEE